MPFHTTNTTNQRIDSSSRIAYCRNGCPMYIRGIDRLPNTVCSTDRRKNPQSRLSRRRKSHSRTDRRSCIRRFRRRLVPQGKRTFRPRCNWCIFCKRNYPNSWTSFPLLCRLYTSLSSKIHRGKHSVHNSRTVCPRNNRWLSAYSRCRTT